MRAGLINTLRGTSHKFVLWLKIIVLVFAGIAPVFMTQQVGAAQMTPRKVTISTSEASETLVDYTFNFTWLTASDIEGIIFEFCNAPLGTCVLPTGMDVDSDITSIGTGGQAPSGFPGTGTFAEGTAQNDCNDFGGSGDTQYCVSRAELASATGTGTFTIKGITNPSISTTYSTVYVRVFLYNNSTFSSASSGQVHYGTVAAAIVRQLTAVGRVAERLKFCVGALTDDETAPNGETVPTDCDTGFPSSTLVDLGIIDNVSVTAAPVEPSVANANLANDNYGLLGVNTNASNGVVISYFPEVASQVSASDTDQLRAFRVIPTDCSSTASSTTDQCFVSDSAGSTISFGSEEFGMAVACINEQGSTANFKPVNSGVIGAAYIGDNDFDEESVASVTSNCDNETFSGYTWGFDTSGNPATLAHTTNSTGKVVDDEMLKIRFGATSSATTPTGTYTVIITYIATATF